jgi:hypothetical protein
MPPVVPGWVAQHSFDPQGQVPVPQGKLAVTQVLPPTHLYPDKHPVELWAVHTDTHSLPEHGNPLHELFMVLLQVPAPLQYWAVNVPVVALHVGAAHRVDVGGYVHSGLDPLQNPAHVEPAVPTQAVLPAGTLVTFEHVAVAADDVQVSQEPVQAREP